MRRDELPLLLASERVAGDRETQPLDRIRMQKAVFIAEQRGPGNWVQFYTFEPYNWGPFSKQLSNDLERLRDQMLLKTQRLGLGGYPAYITTSLGEERVGEVWASLTSTQRQFLSNVRAFVATRSFNELLRDVYAAYPTYAINSQFQG